MTEWDKKISNWIIKALQENDRLGRNKMYDYVDRRYRRNRKKKTGLSKDVFDKHLKFLLQNSIVCKNDLGQRGTTVVHFLCPEAILQLQSGTLDLIAIKNQDKNLMEITSEIKLKALYILILMFNHTTSFEFKNEDEIVSFLKPLHLKIDKKEITKNWRETDIIIREDIQHRLEMDNETRKNAGGIDTDANKMLREKKKGKRLEIENQLEFLQEELNYQMNAYKFIIDKHKFLQDIFEMIFPEFLRHLKLS